MARFGIFKPKGLEDYPTPQSLFDLYDQQFHFNLDAAASKENAKCRRYLTKETDALTQVWVGTVWLNPPYNGLAKWVRKAYEESQNGATVVMLIPAWTSDKWFYDYCQNAEIHFLTPRIRYGNMNHVASFGSMVVIFRPSGAFKVRLIHHPMTEQKMDLGRKPKPKSIPLIAKPKPLKIRTITEIMKEDNVKMASAKRTQDAEILAFAGA